MTRTQRHIFSRIAWGVLLLFFGGSYAFSSPKGGSAAPELKLPAVRACVVEMTESGIESGSVLSDDRIVLRTRMAGFIDKLKVREGQRVRKGEVLLVLDDTDVDATIRQAEAAMLAASAQMHDAELDVQKYTPLTRSGAASRDALDKCLMRRDVTAMTLLQAKEKLMVARSQKSYSTIASPIDGIIVTKHKNSGDLATPGEPLLTIESGKCLLFRFYVPENLVGRIDSSTPVLVRLDALPDSPVLGTIRSVIPSADPGSRRFEVNVVLTDVSRALPGMFGRAEMRLGSRTVLAVPGEAIMSRGGLNGVYVIDDTDHVAFRWLRTGQEQEGMVEIIAGLRLGERIVARNDDRVRDGIRVMSTTDEKDLNNRTTPSALSVNAIPRSGSSL